MLDLNLQAESDESSRYLDSEKHRQPYPEEESGTSDVSSVVTGDATFYEDACSTCTTLDFGIVGRDAGERDAVVTKLIPVRSGGNVNGDVESWNTELGLERREKEVGVQEEGVGVMQQAPPAAVKKSRRGPRPRSSQYRGVTFYRRTGRWESHIWDCGKQVYLGGYDTAQAAARAYDRAAIKFRGVDADLNFNLSDYEEDLKQLSNLTKEEFVHVLRRQGTGFSRGSSKYRGVTLHKCGQWEARMGQLLGKKAYDKAAIKCNGREAVTNFEPSTYQGDMFSGATNEGSDHNLDLNLGISLPGKGSKESKGGLLYQSAHNVHNRSSSMAHQTSGIVGNPHFKGLRTLDHPLLWNGAYPFHNWDCGKNMQAYIGQAATYHSSEEDLINNRRLNNRVSNKWDFEPTDPTRGSTRKLLRQLMEKLNFRTEVLVVLNLTHNNGAQFWMGKQDLVSLKQLDLSCSSLIILPDLSKASKLRSLILQNCSNLVDISSIQFLINLEYLNLNGCTSLRSLPSMMALKLLSSLHLSGCSKIRRLPVSIGCLSSLIVLDIRNCKRLQNLPISASRLKSIQTLNISGCSKLMKNVSRSETEEAPQSAMASSLFLSESINPGSDDIPVIPQNNGIECPSCTPEGGMRSKVKVHEDSLPATVASPLGRTKGIEEFIPEESSESLNQLVAQRCQKRSVESFMGGSSNTADFEEMPLVRRRFSSESEYPSSSTAKERESTELEGGIKPSSLFLEPPLALARNETRPSNGLVQTSPLKNLQSEEHENSAKETALRPPLAFKSSNKCEASLSSGFSQQRKALESYMETPVEAIHESDAYEDIGRILDMMIQQTSDLRKRTNLEDIMSFLEELNESIPDTMNCLKSYRNHRTLLQVKLTCLDLSLVEGQEQGSSLEAKLATISEEEAKLEAEIQLLMAKKEELSKE